MNITLPVDQQLTHSDLYSIVSRTAPLFYERSVVETTYRNVIAENFCICSSIDVICNAMKKDNIRRAPRRDYTQHYSKLIIEWHYKDTEVLYTIHGLTPDQQEKMIKDFDLK